MNLRTAVPNRFAGKVAVVTGGSSGIGQAVVEELCKEGAAVAFSGISEIGRATARELSSHGYQVLFCQGDMADEAFCRAFVQEVLTRWGKVNYLVNNAFSFTAKGLDATRADWERALQTGPMAYALMGQLVAEPIRREGGGAIVNMSSISAFIAQPNRWTYNAAKGAVQTLTKCMALDLAPYNIRVNSVSPGWIWTREVEKAAGGDRAKWEPIWGDFHMLRRCGEPVECAGPILFLLSDDASFITAADLPIDGGYQGLGSEGIGKASKFAGSQ
ncbi:MAG: SDR family oxidoreductase [Bryobacteraceae bacterium]|jgi:NAD(P)-dependent dehydrogenase (short-subunit alcohol dehydrogenase family)